MHYTFNLSCYHYFVFHFNYLITIATTFLIKMFCTFIIFVVVELYIGHFSKHFSIIKRTFNYFFFIDSTIITVIIALAFRFIFIPLIFTLIITIIIIINVNLYPVIQGLSHTFIGISPAISFFILFFFLIYLDIRLPYNL